MIFYLGLLQPRPIPAGVKLNIMESKIFIDINYASRDPQIVIHQKDSDDPRDKLVAIFTGHSMPGVREGYCRIERWSDKNGYTQVGITPIHPVDMIKHIPQITTLAKENKACDTSGVSEAIQTAIREVQGEPLPRNKS